MPFYSARFIYDLNDLIAYLIFFLSFRNLGHVSFYLLKIQRSDPFVMNKLFFSVDVYM